MRSKRAVQESAWKKHGAGRKGRFRRVHERFGGGHEEKNYLKCMDEKSREE